MWLSPSGCCSTSSSERVRSRPDASVPGFSTGRGSSWECLPELPRSRSARGARDVYLMEEPPAAVIGAGLPIHEPGGHLIVDIGGGTTEVAVISMSGTVYCNSVRIAGDEMDEAIIQHIRKQYRLLVGERRAEEIKIAVGSAHPDALERCSIEVKGRDLVDGVPKTLVVTDEEIREALREPVMTIVETVRT